MLQHCCVPVSSEANAKLVFERVFGFRKLYAFHIEADVMRALFDVECEAEAAVYDAGNTRIEVFVLDAPTPARFNHLCLSVDDRDRIAAEAVNAGCTLRKFQRPDAEVWFIVDPDGNLYELKNR